MPTCRKYQSSVHAGHRLALGGESTFLKDEHKPNNPIDKNNQREQISILKETLNSGPTADGPKQ